MVAAEPGAIAASVQILLITGSTRRPSYTKALSDNVERMLGLCGATTIQWDLGEQPLPIADPRFHYDPAQHPDEIVRSLVAIASCSDGFVLSSPIYHNSCSGVLKNALDHLAIPQFSYKPVGLISHGGNRSTQAVDHLRIVVRGLLGVATPTQICTAQADYRDAGEGYELVSSEILRRVERFAVELIFFSAQFALYRQHALHP
jgi:NAD(P)H-dependent FMN reductase